MPRARIFAAHLVSQRDVSAGPGNVPPQQNAVGHLVIQQPPHRGTVPARLGRKPPSARASVDPATNGQAVRPGDHPLRPPLQTIDQHDADRALELLPLGGCRPAAVPNARREHYGNCLTVRFLLVAVFRHGFRAAFWMHAAGVSPVGENHKMRPKGERYDVSLSRNFRGSRHAGWALLDDSPRPGRRPRSWSTNSSRPRRRRNTNGRPSPTKPETGGPGFIANLQDLAAFDQHFQRFSQLAPIVGERFPYFGRLPSFPGHGDDDRILMYIHPDVNYTLFIGLSFLAGVIP